MMQQYEKLDKYFGATTLSGFRRFCLSRPKIVIVISKQMNEIAIAINQRDKGVVTVHVSITESNVNELAYEPMFT